MAVYSTSHWMIDRNLELHVQRINDAILIGQYGDDGMAGKAAISGNREEWEWLIERIKHELD